MTDTQPCPVHTLVEEIKNGTVALKPYTDDLATHLAKVPADDNDAEDPAGCAEFREVLAQVQRDANDIALAHKFDFSTWPRTNTALSDVLAETGSDMLTMQVAALPYRSVVFSLRYPAVGDTLDEVYLAREYVIDDLRIITMRVYQRILNQSPWFYAGFTAGWAFKPTGTEYRVDWITDPKKAFGDKVNDVYPDFAEQYADCHISFFCSALAALSSKGPEIHTLPAPEKLNKQRAKKGRPPIFEYRIVEIPAWAKAKAEGLGGTHASPRLHWRRGHERRLGEGRKTFVHACLVGCADNGFVHKDYSVGSQAARALTPNTPATEESTLRG